MSPIQGELTVANMREWLGRADELSRAGTLDLSGVKRADSSGVAFLLELTRRAKRGGTTVAFTGAGRDLKSLIEFLQVDEVLELK